MKLPTTRTKPNKDINLFTYLLYGQPKAGKTTFAAHFPDAIFLATEPGHKFQDIYKIDIKKWEDMRDAAKLLILDKERKFKTVVIDTADNAYKACSTYTCKKHLIEHESDLGFGKGFNFVRNEFMAVLGGLAQSGYGVIFISHSQTRELDENSIKRAYTDTTLSGGASKVISGLCDFIFYCYINNDGERKMLTKGNQNVNAGDRSGVLPRIMDLDYKQLSERLK